MKLLSTCFCVTLVTFVYAISNIAAELDVRLPPTIVQGPEKNHIFRDDGAKQITLPCVAMASTSIDYTWSRNGFDLNLNAHNNIERAVDGTGTIIITAMSTFDEGFYQCRASTQYGTAMTNTSHLQRAYIVKDSGRSDVINVTRNAGDPFHLSVDPPRCFPPPSFSWVIEHVVGTDNRPRPVVLSQRLQIDDHGQLYFGYGLPEDSSDDKVYKCVVNNPYLDVTQGGSYTRVTIRDNSGGGQLRKFRPTIAFVSQSPMVALQGRNVSLRCFFSGNPEPSVAIERKHGSMPLGRWERKNFNTELLLKNVEPEDEGDYVCSASNSEGNANVTIQIDVQAVPVFRSINDGPRDINATEGDIVVINCTAYAEPDAHIEWYRNGQSLNPNELPSKFHLTPDRKKLTISSVCKNCTDGQSDLQVIQCNASNVHGYAFNGGYINVLERTRLDDDSEKVARVDKDQLTQLEFNCSATSDDSTPPRVRWFHVQNDDDHSLIPVKADGDRLTVSMNGTLILRHMKNSTGSWIDFHGEYLCEATNGYSTATRTVHVLVNDYVPPVAAQRAGIEDSWWLFVVIASILLPIILALCFIYFIVYRGESYKVDAKERQTGNNPDKELQDSGFHDYQRPQEMVSGSRTTLDNVGDDHTGSDDGGSLNAYGADVDFGKFNEEGSFVGEYVDSPRRNASQS